MLISLVKVQLHQRSHFQLSASVDRLGRFWRVPQMSPHHLAPPVKVTTSNHLLLRTSTTLHPVPSRLSPLTHSHLQISSALYKNTNDGWTLLSPKVRLQVQRLTGNLHKSSSPIQTSARFCITLHGGGCGELSPPQAVL